MLLTSTAHGLVGWRTALVMVTQFPFYFFGKLCPSFLNIKKPQKSKLRKKEETGYCWRVQERECHTEARISLLNCSWHSTKYWSLVAGRYFTCQFLDSNRDNTIGLGWSFLPLCLLTLTVHSNVGWRAALGIALSFFNANSVPFRWPKVNSIYHHKRSLRIGGLCRAFSPGM